MKIQFVSSFFNEGPTKQILTLLNERKVMTMRIGAEQPGDILERQMSSVEGPE